jgi:hypothetical protein
MARRWCTRAAPGAVGCSSHSGSERLMPHKHSADRRHHIPKMTFKVRNWPAYEAGLRRRGSFTLWIECRVASRNSGTGCLIKDVIVYQT